MKVAVLIFTVLVAVLCTEEIDRSHGFGTDIDWVSWESALDLANEQNKPVFLMIHKTWCGACKALKKNFKGSNKRAELVELSKKFVMVNLEDDEEPEDERYAPDGAYIPRLFFLDKNGDPMAVDNKKNYPNNAYYFPQAVDVLKAMKVALKEFGGSDEVEKDTVKKEDKKEETVSDKKAKKDKTEETKAEKKTETSEKKEKDDKKEKKTEKVEKKDKTEETKEDKNKTEKKAEKKDKTEKKEKSEKKDKSDKAEKKEKSEKKSEKKDDKKQKDVKKETKDKDSKKEEKKPKKSDDGKKSKKEADKKKKTEL